MRKTHNAHVACQRAAWVDNSRRHSDGCHTCLGSFASALLAFEWIEWRPPESTPDAVTGSLLFCTNIITKRVLTIGACLSKNGAGKTQIIEVKLETVGHPKPCHLRGKRASTASRRRCCGFGFFTNHCTSSAIVWNRDIGWVRACPTLNGTQKGHMEQEAVQMERLKSGWPRDCLRGTR